MTVAQVCAFDLSCYAVIEGLLIPAEVTAARAAMPDDQPVHGIQ